MSRTYRRNQKWAIKQVCGPVEDVTEYHIRRFGARDASHCHQKWINWYISDNGPRWGHFGRFHKRTYYITLCRRRENRKIFNCIKSGDFDGHYGENRFRS